MKVRMNEGGFKNEDAFKSPQNACLPSFNLFSLYPLYLWVA